MKRCCRKQKHRLRHKHTIHTQRQTVQPQKNRNHPLGMMPQSPGEQKQSHTQAQVGQEAASRHEEGKSKSPKQETDPQKQNKKQNVKYDNNESNYHSLIITTYHYFENLCSFC